MKKILVLQVIILVFTHALWAQNNDFPHVSQIRAEVRNNLIRLTWVDSPEARGPVYIFRSARPFTGSIPANIRPIVVRYGEQYYIDDTDELETLYYFIAASDLSGRRYDVIIPRANITGIIRGEAQAEIPGVPTVTVHQGISNLIARQDGDRALITFDSSQPDKNVVLYRSMQPIRQPADLLNAAILYSGTASSFIDYPVPGFTWYYAAIYEDEIAGGDMGIKQGINATISSVIITGDQAAERSMRPIPLPILTLRGTLPGSYFMSDIPAGLSETSANVLRDNPPHKVPMQLRRPRAFAVDLEAPTGGEASALFQIVMEYFVKFDWEGANTYLQQYLSLPRSREVEARARFYLGQTLYYTGKYREALLEFLIFRSYHPAEANIWIEAVLTAMVY